MKHYKIYSKRDESIIFYEGNSLNQAIKTARKYDTVMNWVAIVNNSTGAFLQNWEAAKPFWPKNEPYWSD